MNAACNTLYRWCAVLLVVSGLLLCSCSQEEQSPSQGPPQTARQFEEIRGIIHAHSIYSHDACDNRPEGNTECLMQLREALCTTHQDYIMLTDHRSTFAEHEFPEVLLYLPEQGDELVQDAQGRPYANRIPCPDGSLVTLMAGTENEIMPVHLHRHPEGSEADRMALYGRKDHGAVELLHGLGASVIASHAEGWSSEELIDLAPDGIEVFNLHAAIAPDLRPHLGVDPLDFLGPLLTFLFDPTKPDPDLVIMTFFPRTEAWTQRWDAMLARQRCYGIAATDCHRNALPFALSDGDRGDSYRRMMQFFTNRLLVEEEAPEAIEEAVDTGRGYVAFEFLGMPQGFAMYATDGATTYAMGDEISGQTGDLRIHVARPSVYGLDPAGPQPRITLRLVRIDGQGSRVVTETEEDITYSARGPAVYRSEVSMVPYHLRPRLGSLADTLIHEYPWLYSNPIYVRSSVP